MAIITDDGLYHIDLSADDGFTVIQSILPENLEFDDRIRGPGNCSFQVSFSAKDEDGQTIVIPANTVPGRVPFVGPYRSFFRLRYGATVIMAGPIVSTNTKLGDEFVSVSGKTWEHYLERWQYPFDPRVTPTDDVDHSEDYIFPFALMGNEGGPGSGEPNDKSGMAYQCYSRDVVLIISDILSQTMNAVPYRHIIDLSNLAAGLSGLHANVQFALGDTTYMDSFINTYAEIGQGMDWWISWDNKFYWASPYRFGDPSNPTIAIMIDNNTPMPVGGIGLENNGPAATHVLGKGAGLASATGLQRAYGSPMNQDRFSRLDKSYDFGDFRNKNTLILRTRKQLLNDIQPQHQTPLQLDPAHIPNFWQIFRKGRGIYIEYDLVSNYIDSLYQIMSYTAKDENNSGNILVDFTIEQRFDLPLDPNEVPSDNNHPEG